MGQCSRLASPKRWRLDHGCRKSIMAIELRHLRCAVAAAHYGSFRRAAEALGVKQSSLSRRIRQMEDRLGVAVFERSSSGVRLTTAGTEILRTSRHLVDGLDHMT